MLFYTAGHPTTCCDKVTLFSCYKVVGYWIITTFVVASLFRVRELNILGFFFLVSPATVQILRCRLVFVLKFVACPTFRVNKFLKLRQVTCSEFEFTYR